VGLWQEILIVAGGAIVGLLVGFLFMYLFFREKSKESRVWDKGADTIEMENPKFSITTALSNGPMKLSGSEDVLESLIRNNKNSITSENLTKTEAIDIPSGVKITSQKNIPIMEKVEKPFQPAIQRNVLATQGKRLKRKEHNPPNELPAKKSLVEGIKNASIMGEHKEPIAHNTLGELVFDHQKATALEDKQNEATVSVVSKKPDTDIPSHLPVVTEQKESTISGILEQKIASAETKQKESPKSDFIAELETNLAIASTPWTDKLISFQTKCWDVSHGEFEPMSAIHQQELIQLYVDMGLANNIVWMAREIGSRSKDLDESYIKLCADIAANIKKLLPPSNSLSR